MMVEENFDKFHNSRYRGLYNEETAADIFKRKGLRYRKDILDNMGSAELAANLFRITQTEEKLVNDKIKSELDTYYIVGKMISDYGKHYGDNIIKQHSERLNATSKI